MQLNLSAYTKELIIINLMQNHAVAVIITTIIIMKTIIIRHSQVLKGHLHLFIHISLSLYPLLLLI